MGPGYCMICSDLPRFTWFALSKVWGWSQKDRKGSAQGDHKLRLLRKNDKEKNAISVNWEDQTSWYEHKFSFMICSCATIVLCRQLIPQSSSGLKAFFLRFECKVTSQCTHLALINTHMCLLNADPMIYDRLKCKQLPSFFGSVVLPQNKELEDND